MTTGVAIALCAALVSLFAGLAFWNARRGPKPAPTKGSDRAWDLHARARSSAPPPASSKQKAPESKSGAKAPESKSGAKAPQSKPGAKAPQSKPGAKAPQSKPGAKAAAKAPPPKPAAKAASVRPAPPATPPLGQEKAATSPDLLPSLQDDDDDDADLTIITLGPPKGAPKLVLLSSDDLEEEDDDNDGEPAGASAVPIVYDADAAIDEPTHVHSLILVSAAGHTDRGQRRRKNEDSYAILDSAGLFIVADGMGGHSGGEIASKIAVDTVVEAFKANKFPGELYPGVPRRGSELALAIQQANLAIFERARVEQQLTGMGTTVVSARFSPNKQRAYIGHVGDSRCYRLRNEELRQVTTDHTMGAVGLTGPLADRLERAVGIGPAVKVDVILARPLPEDIYLLCSDGLSKMVTSAQIREILMAEKKLSEAAQKLVERANASGGKDNITVILVKVTSPSELAKSLRA